jgi:hypothetical protein
LEDAVRWTNKKYAVETLLLSLKRSVAMGMIHPIHGGF